MKIKKSLHPVAFAAFLLLAAVPAHAWDSASLEAGRGEHTRLARVGLQWSWDRQWWKSNGTHIGGYWNLTLAQWHASRHRDVAGNSKDIYVLGITPVFRFQSDDLKGFYAEAGIGAHLMSDLYDNDGKQLSTRFQFGDHIGIGYVFDNKLDVGLKYQHFSNGGIKKPNDGVDFTVVSVRYAF